MKKEFIRLSGVLCLIALVAALLLAGVNKITAPKIVEAEEKAAQVAMKAVLPSASRFSRVTDDVRMGMNNGVGVGYCVSVKTNGYGGEISVMVGLDMENNVQGIEILSHNETAGLGAKATDEAFKSQFSGKKTPLTVVKKGAKNESEIQAITGATITSRAVADAVTKASSLVEEAKGGAK